jgi:hypothetical protein
MSASLAEGRPSVEEVTQWLAQPHRRHQRAGCGPHRLGLAPRAHSSGRLRPRAYALADERRRRACRTKSNRLTVRRSDKRQRLDHGCAEVASRGVFSPGHPRGARNRQQDEMLKLHNILLLWNF